MALSEDESLPLAVIADPRAVGERWPDARLRLLADLARRVAEAPWSLRRADAEAAASVGLGDEHLLHAVALAAFFGHLNRIADAVEVPLDYPVLHAPPRAEPATPPLLRARATVTTPARLSLDARPATAAALEAWRAHALDRDAGPLDRVGRAGMAAHVAALLGSPRGSSSEGGADVAADRSPLEAELRGLAERVTLSPWRLDAAAYAPLRRLGFDDAALFDAVVVASTAGVIARIDVALRSLESPA